MRDALGQSFRWEDWSRGDSFLHHLDARGKILSVLSLLIAISVIPPTSPVAYLPISAVLFAGFLVSGLPIAQLLSRGAIVIPFPLFFGFVGWLENGNWLFSVTIVVRSYISTLAVLLLIGVTPLPDLLRGLRGLYVPAVLVVILQSLVRYLQVILDHGLRMRRAALCRDGRAMDGKHRQSLWRRASGALAVLFGRSYQRAEGVHRAMAARGFQGEFISPRAAKFSLTDWFYLSGVALAAAGASYWARVAG